MKFTFWQNIISIHQSAFLNALSEKHDVVLVVEKDMEEERKDQGWNIPGLEKIIIMVAPEENKMVELLDDKAIHVFSGISAYPMVAMAFRYAIKNGLMIGIMLEPFNWKGLKGILRWMKYYFLKIRFGNKINFIIPTGELGMMQYGKIGFNKRTLFEWGYFVDWSEMSLYKAMKTMEFQKPSILFTGSIEERKNILPQIEIIRKFEKKISKITIVGDGPLRQNLISKIQGNTIFDVKGNLPNIEVRKLMANHDILILPSKFDGWGAVVNEALQAGMRVIASENCGAAVLLDGEVRGEKFQLNGNNDFETVLLKWINMGALNQEERKNISDWSKEHISGEVAAVYFEQIVEHVFSENTERPIPPWRN